jgi:hypothetical protein
MKNENKAKVKTESKMKNVGNRNKKQSEPKKKHRCGKEIVIIAIAFTVVIALSLGVAIFSIVRKLDVVPNGKTYQGGVEGLKVEIDSVDNDGKSPRITLRWINETGGSVVPYPMYFIEMWNGDAWVKAESDDAETSYPEETFTIPNGSIEYIEYSTSAAEFVRGGKYRLRTYFNCDVSSGSKIAWVEFEIK